MQYHSFNSLNESSFVNCWYSDCSSYDKPMNDVDQTLLANGFTSFERSTHKLVVNTSS